MLSFLCNPRLLFGIGLASLALFLWFYIHGLRQEVKALEFEASLWQESAESAQVAIDSLQTYQESMEKAFQASLLERAKIEAETATKKQNMEVLKQENLSVKEWANEKIPKDIQNLLL